MSSRKRPFHPLPTAAVVVATLTACAGGNTAPPSTLAEAPESMWRMLAEAQTMPLEDAPRVSVSGINVLTGAWEGTRAISRELALEELIAAGLLRRRDVTYVERRRFAAAVAREERGLPRAPNAPEAGNSPGARYLLTGAWAATGDSATLDLRLVDVNSSEVYASWRAHTPLSADPTSVARLAVGTLVQNLERMGVLPSWSDPVALAAPTAFVASDVADEATRAFLQGLEAEDRYDWEAARRGYQSAMELAGPGFFEPGAALARVARLRAGGTLGRND